jgi:eukaryotic-like serine/threonine-protein kinase
MFELLSGVRMRAELRDALAHESRRLNLHVNRIAQLVFGCSTLAGVVVAVFVARRVGLAVAGASALYFVSSTVMARVYERGPDGPLIHTLMALTEGTMPWVYALWLTFSKGAGYALASWIPPLLFAAVLVSGIVRLRPMLCAVGGAAGGAIYALLYFLVVRDRLSPEDASNVIFQPGLQISRALLLAFVGGATALLTVGLRSVVARAESAARQQDLFGKYRLVRPIAAGGMGEVFEAVYCPEGGFERRVAVKRIHPMHARDVRFVERFRAEAELTAHLAHPNIVQVMDFGSIADSYFLAMEYVDGMTLAAFLDHSAAAQGRLGPDVVGFIGREVLAALAYAHTARRPDGGPLRVIHCDLCPHNVLLSRIGEVKVIDFGVARALRGSASTQTRTVRGHLCYLAPETIEQRPINERTDLHAVGLILWELLTGRPVFQMENEAAALHAILTYTPSPATALRSDLDPAWDEFFAKALARDPAARFPSARAMADALDEIEGTRGEGAARRIAELVEAFRATPAVTSAHAGDDGVTLVATPVGDDATLAADGRSRAQ